jgi:hypothetical protein
MKICTVGAEVFFCADRQTRWTDGQTDMTKLIVVIRDFFALAGKW